MSEKIKIAKTAGFCMGVRRAVEIALEEASLRQKNESIKTFGPLIHNPQVLDLLEEKDIPSIENIPEKGEGTIIIRAHGVPPEVKHKLKDVGFKILDATCPRVIKVQAIIKKHSALGYNVIIVGDHDHAEVIGLAGYAGEKGIVINSMEEFENLPVYEKAIIVAQTTQNTKFYDEIQKRVKERHLSYKVFNTICDSTEKRQEEIKKIAKEVDAVIVVGGKTSGNTKRLKEVALQQGTESFHIESEKELDSEYIASLDKVGITAGASTPNWVISQVYKNIETAKLKQKKSRLLAFFFILKFLLRTNILLGIGAASITFGSYCLAGLSPVDIRVIIAASFYIFSIHAINNIALIKSDRFNDPEKARLYEKNKIFIGLSAVISGVIGLMIGYSIGILPFLLIFFMFISGLCYKMPVFYIPRITKGFQSLDKINGAKAFVIAGAWGVIAAVIPFIAIGEIDFSKIFSVAVSFIFISSMVFARSIWFDILAIQGNKIAGEITIPILMGEEKAYRLLIYILLFVALFLILASVSGISTSFGYILAIYPAIFLSFIVFDRRKTLQPDFFADVITESMFLIVGFFAILWKVF